MGYKNAQKRELMSSKTGEAIQKKKKETEAERLAREEKEDEEWGAPARSLRCSVLPRRPLTACAPRRREAVRELLRPRHHLRDDDLADLGAAQLRGRVGDARADGGGRRGHDGPARHHHGRLRWHGRRAGGHDGHRRRQRRAGLPRLRARR